jgi:hypothetical protein
MKLKVCACLLLTMGLFSCNGQETENSPAGNQRFDVQKDLLLAQYDCKTDVDDLHSVAGLVTLLSHPDYTALKYHAVAGTYGMQEGLYVPPNPLFQKAFGDNWSDAHSDFQMAVQRVRGIAMEALGNGADIWIAEAGQSDFSAALVQSILAAQPDLDRNRIHVVQHSTWNEEVTSPESLRYVRQHTDYQKIGDGNVVGNGTPGFRTPGYTDWKQELSDPGVLEVWQMAVDLALQYNGKEGRYNNKAVAENGLDFSDLSEVCWMLGLESIRDTDAFFKRFGK